MKWIIAFLCLMLVACDTGGGSDASEEDLTGALLIVEDMPAGWSIEEDAGDDDGDVVGQFCNVAPVNELIDADAEAERRFTAGESGPFFTQLLTAMEYESDAEAGMDRIREALGCGEWTDAEADTTWTISEISFPDLGEETAAYRFSTTNGSSSTNGNVVAIRDGGVVLLVVHIELGELNSGLTEELTRKAFDKAQGM